MRLPGACIVCRQPVVWNGIAWRRPSGGANHVCPVERPTCGAWMPQARERCARGPWHHGDHRSSYAMENERTAKSARGYTSSVGASGTHHMQRPGSCLLQSSPVVAASRGARAYEQG